MPPRALRRMRPRPNRSKERSLFVAVSPYHLTTREAPAMASLLLAERVLTMVPAPGSSTATQATTAGARIPGYLAFMNTWSWTVPLWQAGVLAAEHEGQSAVADMQAVSGRVESDELLAPLRRFMHSELYQDEQAYLSAVAADLLKGGPDPGINVPVAAGIDRFATRHQLLVARAQPTSVVQVAESRMGERLDSIALPVLLQADADRILHAREVLADVLEGLWDAYDDLTDEIEDGASLTDAATAYTDAYTDRQGEITMGGEDDDVRIVEGTVTVHAVRMPSDVVLRSSLAAVENLTGRQKSAPVATNGSDLAHYDPLAAQTFISLVIKPLGARPQQRRR